MRVVARLGRAFSRWQRSETRVLFALTIVVGCLSGLAAVGFHRSIDLVAAHTLVPLLSLPVPERFTLFAVLLILVGCLVCLTVEYVAPFARGSGIPEVKAAYLLTPGPQLSLKTIVGKFVLGALGIGA